MNQTSDWQLVIQFPRPQEAEFESLVARLIPEGLVKIWHPLKRIAWYRLSLLSKDLGRMIGVLHHLRGVKDLQVFINQVLVPSETLWALNCFADPPQIYRPCEMQRTPQTIIGCPQGFLSLEAHHPSAWYLRLKADDQHASDRWTLGDDSWQAYLQSRLGHFFHCPELEQRGNLHFLTKLPTTLELHGQAADVFDVVIQGTRKVLRVKNRELYDQWLYGSILND